MPRTPRDTSLASPAAVKAALHSLGLRPRKRLGQHFVIDRRVLQSVVKAAELSPVDVVVEVGPGLGVLTRELARRAGKVIAVEIDDKLSAALRQSLSSFPNVQIINADILQTDIRELLSPGKGDKGGEVAPSYKVVANLPYSITSPVLRHFLEASIKPSVMVVMVQKEVGEAITAPSGRMSLLSVSVQFYAQTKIVAVVPPGSFFPPPQVDSVVLRLVPRSQPLVEVPDVPWFFAVVRAGFSAPRKQLVNSLSQGLGLLAGELSSLLHQMGIDPRRRAQTLTLEEWARLCLYLTPGANSVA